MSKPSVGRIVHVFADPKDNNGADIAPAVITRVWSDEMVNLRVLHDGPIIDWRTSIPLLADREAVEAKYADLPEDQRPAVPYGAFWPPRVGE